MRRIEIKKNTGEVCKLVPEVKMEQMYKVLLILPISMLVFAFICNTPREIVEGLGQIIQASDVLITDYLLVANTGAAFANSAIIMLFNLALLYKLKLKPNGVIISALFLIGGFAFMGKNLYNIWPFYLGGYAYSRYHKIPYKNVVVINMLATALSPLSSFVTQAIDGQAILSIFLTAIISGFIGFIMPTISSHVVGSHLGYSLYNMGAATGFVGMIVYGLISGLGLKIDKSSGFYEQFDMRLIIFFVSFAVLLIILGYYFNEKTFKGYGELTRRPGRLITDMIKQDGFGLSLVNMGILALICIGYTYLMGGVLNGPIIASMFTVIGFGTFGKHPRNTLPLMIGVTLGMLVMGRDRGVSVMVMSALFGTTLAPIAGEYGIVWGILAGILHSGLVMNIGDSHGGIALYNNGLSGGIIAMILIPMIDAFKREKEHET